MSGSLRIISEKLTLKQSSTYSFTKNKDFRYVMTTYDKREYTCHVLQRCLFSKYSW